MATYTYSVVGAGSTSDNPVTVYHECGVGTVQVCWTGRLSTNGKCGENMYLNEEYCDSRTVSPNVSSFIWTAPDGTTHPVYYKTISRPCPPDPTGCTSGCVNSTLTAYASPMYISDNGNTSIYYDSVVKCYGRVSGVIQKYDITFGGGEEKEISFTTPYGCNGKVVVYKAEEDECTPGCKTNVSVSVNREYVPASGTSISGSEITFTYKKVVTDDECRKKTTNGMYTYDDSVIIEIPECISGASGSGKEYQCCHDHYVDMNIPVSALSEHLDACDIYYNGDKIDSDGTIPYRILQKAKTSGECSGTCEGKTTYCVDQNSVKVCYETRYLSDKWVCEGDTLSGCACSALTIDGVNGTFSVPYTGGRIKVKWDYSAHTITDNCTEYDTTGGTWEEIITVGGCDERPIDCKSEYGYDDETYSGCKICDAECCYDYDGNGTCRCVILFKEQTPGCTTCDNYALWDDEEQRYITYNKIRYRFKQDCTPMCDYTKNTQFEKQKIMVDKCFTGETGATVNFISTIEYNGIGCPPPEIEEGSLAVRVSVDGVNNSAREKIVYEDDMIKVTQDAGPCEPPVVDCDCDSLSVEGGSPTPTPSECVCELHGIHFEYSKYPSDGSNGSKVKVGTYKLKSDCSSTPGFDRIVAGSNNQSTSYKIWNSTSDFEFRDDGFIWAAVPKNNTNGVIHIHCHFKCKDSATASDNDYINFYQEAGGGGSCKNWGAWGKWQQATVDCRGGDTGATLTRTRTCITDPSIEDEQTTAVTFEMTECNDGGSKEIYNNDGKIVVQEGGCDCSSETCNPSTTSDVNSSLNSCITKVTNGTELASKISISETPCTYYYLQKGFEYLARAGVTNDDAKLWFLANMLCELTPDGGLMNSYFTNAAEGGGGKNAPLYKSDVETTPNPVYENRIQGARYYAMFKGSTDYAEGNKAAEMARKDLRKRGVNKNKAAMKDYSPETTTSVVKISCLVYFNRYTSQLSDPKNVLPTSHPTNNKEMSDWIIAQNYISDKPTSDKLAPSYQAIYDKSYEASYICETVNGVSSTLYSDYTFFATDIADALNNRTKEYYKRPRPGQQYKIEKDKGASYFSGVPGNPAKKTDFVFLCDCAIEADQPGGEGGTDCDYCKLERDGHLQENTSEPVSFPSGHSAKAFMSYLALCEVGKGNYNRTVQYCENRAVVRAHWRSDTVGGKYTASMGIGILNGYKAWQMYRKMVLNGQGDLKFGNNRNNAIEALDDTDIFTD